jgi:hypothetical protein
MIAPSKQELKEIEEYCNSLSYDEALKISNSLQFGHPSAKPYYVEIVDSEYGYVVGYMIDGCWKAPNSANLRQILIWNLSCSIVNPLPKEMTERQYQKKLAHHLYANDWMVTLECNTPVGRIDIFAERGGETMIIETKIKALSNDMSSALGQILFYSTYHPNAALYISSPQKPSEKVLSILAKFNVEFMELK